MALLATQQAITAGIIPTYSAVASSDTCVPGDNVVIHVKNGGGSPDTVTLVTPFTLDTLALADRAVTVAAGAEKFIAVPASLYQDPTTGLATIQHSFITSVTCAVIGV